MAANCRGEIQPEKGEDNQTFHSKGTGTSESGEGGRGWRKRSVDALLGEPNATLRRLVRFGFVWSYQRESSLYSDCPVLGTLGPACLGPTQHLVNIWYLFVAQEAGHYDFSYSVPITGKLHSYHIFSALSWSVDQL